MRISISIRIQAPFVSPFILLSRIEAVVFILFATIVVVVLTVSLSSFQFFLS
jgi:hypothetical protein